MNRLYFDFNASTPIDPQVLNILIQELEEEVGNPSSIHWHGQKCRKKLEQSRSTIAHFFKVKSHEIIFTSGGTEGASLLIRGMCPQNRTGHIITSSAEHACVYETLKMMEKKGVPVTFLPTGEKGTVTPDDVEKAIRKETALITLMAVNNETGVKTDIEAIAKIAESYRIPFLVDGVAWLGKENVTIPSGVSAIFFSGHKIHAPKGIGFCFCRSSVKLTPLYVGGGQEFNKRPGTENLPGIVALAEAISILKQNQTEQIAHMERMRDLFEMHVLSALPDVLINGSGPRICNTSNLAFLGIDGEILLMNLDLEGISVSHGSACSSGALEPSRILLEMGLPRSRVNSSIRFSIGRTTTLEEIEAAAQIIIKVVKKLSRVK